MKRIVAFIISSIMLLTGCSSNVASSDSPADTVSEIMPDNTSSMSENISESKISGEDLEPDTKSEQYIESLGFMTLDDPELIQYVADTVYSELVYELNSDDYIIEDVQSRYMPEEYYADVEANSKENIYFGYKASELNNVFQGTKYVFTLDESGQTIVEEMEVLSDDIYSDIVKNVAIGSGVILICVTVSVVSAGAGAPAVSMIFAASAKTATSFAVSSAAIGSVSSAIVKGIETRNVEESMKAAAIGATEGFKWGAIIGAVAGGISEGVELAWAGNAISNAVQSGNRSAIGKTGEQYVMKFYEGETQLSFLNGKKVPYVTLGSTRPDITRQLADGSVEAIEVKNYDLVNHLGDLKAELKRQVSNRVVNLPAGSTQRIALVTKGRGYTKAFTNQIVEELQTYLFPIYGSAIPIDVF